MLDAAGWRPLTALPRRATRPGEPGHVVALRDGAVLTTADFAAAVAAWRDALAPLAGARWALYLEDSFDFAAALFGAWHAGKTVVVPGDMQADTVARLRAGTDGFLGELPGSIAPPARTARAPGGFAALDAASVRLVVHTSGTSGEPLAIPKRLAQLDAEVHALEARFGTLCDTGLAPANHTPDANVADASSDRFDGVPDPAPVVWATVSHQHIYGLLFRVLWPLAAGRPFVAGRLAYNEEIARRIDGPAVLVASPAHLRRLPEAADWSAARAGLRAVFSSGGPLPPEAAESALALLGTAPAEVYGSSETGGVAWRQRARHGDTWQPLPGVAFRIEDGELQVRSPHLPDDDWYRSADRAAPAADGMDGFELQGRADRIVKIEEKRVSLSALERRLLENPEIAEARVLMLAGDDAAAAAVARPAVVAALSESGRAALARAGKPALVARLRESLLAAVDRVALPRRWRFVDALPANAQGKSPEAMLAALFAPARPLRPQPEWIVDEAARAVAVFVLAPELMVFDGHFPGRAILPGVAQLDWAIGWARERFALPPVFLRLETLKFSQPVGPGTRVELELNWNADGGSVQFEYRSDAGRHSGGRVVFGAAEVVE